jgi:hypothetical protein
MQKSTYYGYIDEIWEVNYRISLQIPVFKCQWVKHPHGIQVDEYGFTIVDLRNVGHKDEPWVLASTVAYRPLLQCLFVVVTNYFQFYIIYNCCGPCCEFVFQ